MGNKSKNGTTVRVHGVACTNPECDHFQHVMAFGFHCENCGHPMRLGSAAVASFRWDDPKTRQHQQESGCHTQPQP